MEGNTNLILFFFRWWYGDVVASVFTFIKKFFQYLFDLFSVRICLSTLLSPWKRDQLSYQGLSIKEKIDVATLNLVSRLVGSIVKGLTLIAYLVTTVFFFAVSVVAILVYLGYPIILVCLVYYGYKLVLK